MPGRSPLPRNVVVLSWVSLFADISGEMVYPLIPLFIVDVLGASGATLGGIEGSAQLLVALMTAWAGVRSDRWGRRLPYIRAGYGLPVLGKAVMAVSFAWPMAMVGRLLDRFGKGLRGSPRDALIADAAGPEMRGRAFGFHRAMDTAGAVIGVLIAAAIVWWLGGSPAPAGERGAAAAESGSAYRTAIGIAAALGLISFGITFLARESSRTDSRPVAESDAARRSGGRARFSANYWRTLAVLLVFALGNSSDAFLLLRARGLGLSPWAVVLAYALYNFVYMALSYPAGLLSDRVGRWRVMSAGWAIYAVAYAGIATTGAAGIGPLLAVYGTYMALTDGVSKALIADHTPAGRHGAGLGIFQMATGITALLASLIAGLLWDRVGPHAPFWFGAALAFIAAALIPILRPRSRSAANQE